MIITKNQLTAEALSSVGKHSSTRIDKERNSLKSSRDGNARHEPQWVRGKESLLCDPRSRFRLGGRSNIRPKTMNGMGIKKRINNNQLR